MIRVVSADELRTLRGHSAQFLALADELVQERAAHQQSHAALTLAGAIEGALREEGAALRIVLDELGADRAWVQARVSELFLAGLSGAVR
ncbi:hypothetical protein AB0O82_32665 [Kitasatospora sp. NPDC088264]|uniref:hypothetical protein n=1 Tax=Kitasatospora sp. NPDC088264 TaxID=3155296 RepID=UPI003418FD82